MLITLVRPARTFSSATTSADTIEEQFKKGIAEDYGDLTDIVCDAKPVLTNIEKSIECLALTN